jgi:2-haloacid dehalogenase
MHGFARPGADPAQRVDAVLFDLLMAVMNSLAIWSEAAGDERAGLAWRDAVTRRITASPAYVPYEEQVVAATADAGLPREAASELFARWPEIEPWPDSAALARLALPYAFVTNCSQTLARVAADRARLAPRFVLSAEEAGWYKPDHRIYQEACRRLPSPPASTLFVAGSAYDADGARAAGLPSVLVARRPDEHAERRAASLADIAAEIATSGSSRC